MSAARASRSRRKVAGATAVTSLARDGGAPRPSARATGGDDGNSWQPRQSGPSRRLVLSLFAVVFTVLCVYSYTHKSATWDEPVHLTSGYLAWQGDYRLDPAHPPFARMWAALPLLAHSLTLEPLPAGTDSTTWLEGRSQYRYARTFLYDGNDADRLLFAARFMIVMFGLAAGFVLFQWADQWLGRRAALCGLVFFTLSPNLVAHASLVTTDMAATSFQFGAVYFLWRVFRAGTPHAPDALGVALCTSLALVSKFSALILGPVLLLLTLLAVFSRRDVTWRHASWLAAMIVCASFATIWAVYGFRYAPGPSAEWIFHLHDAASVRENAPLISSLVAWVDSHHWLPNAYVEGLLDLTAWSSQANSAYLLGAYSNDGWFLYFPIAFLVKAPVSLLLLLALGLIAVSRRGGQLGRLNSAFVLVPAALYLAVAIPSGVNIGVRHILPIWPFVLLVASAGADWLLTWSAPIGRLAFGAMLLFWAVSVGMVYPHTLTFFNRAVGGPQEGVRYLTDSNLDWGQHLKLLKQWMDREGVEHVNLAYFGEAAPQYYDINGTYLPGSTGFAGERLDRPKLPGYVAIGSTVLSGVYLPPAWRLFYAGFWDREPTVVMGNSIRVYWVDEWPELPAIGPDPPTVDNAPPVHALLADALLRDLSWPEHAVIHYREYLSRKPDDAQALGNFGLALLGIGRLEEASEAFRHATLLRPEDGVLQRNAAVAFARADLLADALEHAFRAVALRPRDPVALDILGRTVARFGRVDEAVRYFRRALEIDPRYLPARQDLETVLKANRRAPAEHAR